MWPDLSDRAGRPLPLRARDALLPLTPLVLVTAMVAAACGTSDVALEVGATTIDRTALTQLVEDSYGPDSVGSTMGTDGVVEVLDQMVRYEAVVDMLAEHGLEAGADDLDARVRGRGLRRQSSIWKKSPLRSLRPVSSSSRSTVVYSSR